MKSLLIALLLIGFPTAATSQQILLNDPAGIATNETGNVELGTQYWHNYSVQFDFTIPSEGMSGTYAFEMNFGRNPYHETRVRVEVDNGYWYPIYSDGAGNAEGTCNSNAGFPESPREDGIVRSGGTYRYRFNFEDWSHSITDLTSGENVSATCAVERGDKTGTIWVYVRPGIATSNLLIVGIDTQPVNAAALSFSALKSRF
jgi:hypothetical protein